jgi:hypothetical protein
MWWFCRRRTWSYHQPVANPFPALVLVFPRDFVVATEKRATHAAIDAADNRNVLIRQNIPPIRPRHGDDTNSLTPCLVESSKLSKKGTRTRANCQTTGGWPPVSPETVGWFVFELRKQFNRWLFDEHVLGEVVHLAERSIEE